MAKIIGNPCFDDTNYINPYTIFEFTEHTFTSAGVANSINGPTLSQCKTAYSGQEWSLNENFFNVLGNGVQVWTVPTTGWYKIKAAGAKGSGSGGQGAILEGEFQLISETKLFIAIGQTGSSSSCGGGGGGGTFVAYEKSDGETATWTTIKMLPLIIAGGGGGQRDAGSFGPQNGSMGTQGTLPDGSLSSLNGNGGQGGATSGAGGWSGNGALGNSNITNNLDSGKSFLNGGSGSAHNYSVGNFAGGSGGTCNVCNTAAGAGHGGGYSGGASYNTAPTCYEGGGGGGSFLRGDVQNPKTSNGNWQTTGTEPQSCYQGSVGNLAEFNNNSGYVIVTKL